MPIDESPPIALPDPVPDPAPADAAGDDLAAVRALILAAHPDVVPDLVAGASVAELLASVDGARAAYAAVAQRMQVSHVPEVLAPVPMTIPAGGGAPLPVDPDRLPASEKIRRGLRAVPVAGERRASR